MEGILAAVKLSWKNRPQVEQTGKLQSSKQMGMLPTSGDKDRGGALEIISEILTVSETVRNFLFFSLEASISCSSQCDRAEQRLAELFKLLRKLWGESSTHRDNAHLHTHGHNWINPKI